MKMQNLKIIEVSDTTTNKAKIVTEINKRKVVLEDKDGEIKIIMTGAPPILEDFIVDTDVELELRKPQKTLNDIEVFPLCEK